MLNPFLPGPCNPGRLERPTLASKVTMGIAPEHTGLLPHSLSLPQGHPQDGLAKAIHVPSCFPALSPRAPLTSGCHNVAP